MVVSCLRIFVYINALRSFLGELTVPASDFELRGAPVTYIQLESAEEEAGESIIISGVEVTSSISLGKLTMRDTPCEHFQQCADSD